MEYAHLQNYQSMLGFSHFHTNQSNEFLLIHTHQDLFYMPHTSKGCKGNNTANCVKNMKLGIVISFKTLIQNFKGLQF